MLPSPLIRALPLAAVLLATTAAAQRPAPNLQPCRIPGYDGEAQCGTLEVPENRDRPDGRKVSLNIVLVPATAPGKAREAVTFFGGGPGQAATDFGGWVASGWAAARDTRDFVFVDQRGTGKSSRLDCPLRNAADPQSYIDGFISAPLAAACLDSLSRERDLTRYGYADLAHDIEDVRVAMGYDRLNLWGGSYGTRAAQVYARMYPQNVRSIVLHGLVPAEFLQPADYAVDTDASLAGLFAECAASPECHAAFPDPARELREVSARLERERGSAEILDPTLGRRVRLTISRDDFAEIIRRMMYDPTVARLVPLFVHRAHGGDFRPIIRQALRDRRGMETGSAWGLYLAITCTEDVPFIDQAAAAAARSRTLLGDYRIREQAAACRGWPRAPLPANYHQPVRSELPVLLLSGELDPVTPPRWAEMAAAAFPNHLHVVVPGGAHGFEGMPGVECVDSLTVRFLKQGSSRGLDAAGCVRSIRRPPFTLELPEAIELDQAVIDRLAGTYLEASGDSLRVEALPGAIKVQGGGSLLAVPLSPTRFQWEGFPAGFEVVFSGDGRTMTIVQPGQPNEVATRRP